MLTENEAAWSFAYVEQAARALVASDRALGLPVRPVGQARADAIAALLSGQAPIPVAAPCSADSSSGGSPCESAGAQPTTIINLTVPLASLLAGLTGPSSDPGSPPLDWALGGLDRPMPGELPWIGAVAPEVALEAALDRLRDLAGGRVGVRWIAVGADGQARAVTGTSYAAPPLLRAALEARDRTCRFPGCTRPADRCDCDHNRPFPAGATSSGNTCFLCRTHHRLKTHSGWSVTHARDGTLTWTSPLGRTYRTHPGLWADPVDPPGGVDLDLPDLDRYGSPARGIPPDPAQSWSDDEYRAWVERLCADDPDLLDLPEATGPDLPPAWWAAGLLGRWPRRSMRPPDAGPDSGRPIRSERHRQNGGVPRDELPPVPEPLPLPVVDNHTHLDHARAGGEPVAVDRAIEAATGVNVTRMVQIGCELESARWTVGAVERHPELLGGVALHPTEATDLFHRGAGGGDRRRGMAALESALDEIERLAAHPRIRVIGETGLDHYWVKEDDAAGRRAQQESFRRHIDLAKRLGKALQIHDRDAHADVLRILDEEGAPERTVFHCFSGDAQMARHCADRGWYLSFAGTLTFKNAAPLREALELMPAALVQVETDAPYLAPMPYRGRPNAGYLVPITVRCMAELTGRSLEQVCTDLDATAERLYGPW